jgi:small subunit ribosomal protein S18
MARDRDRDRDRDRKRSPKDLARRAKKRVCIFCKDHIEWVDYKDVNLLRRFISDRGKIRARRVSGNCAQHQREVAVAIKTARELALLPYAQRTTQERTGPRGPRGMDSAPRPPRDEDAADVLDDLAAIDLGAGGLDLGDDVAGIGVDASGDEDVSGAPVEVDAAESESAEPATTSHVDG